MLIMQTCLAYSWVLWMDPSGTESSRHPNSRSMTVHLIIHQENTVIVFIEQNLRTKKMMVCWEDIPELNRSELLA